MLEKYKKLKSLILILLAVTCGSVTLAAGPQAGGGGLWLSGGQDNHNTRNNPTETKIGPDNAASLTLAWALSTDADVTATPAVDGTSVYVPDWAGNLYSVDRDTGAVNWSTTISDYNFLPAAFGGLSRATPAVHGNSLIFGDQGGRGFAGASVMSVNKHDGSLNWITKVEDHAAAMVTQSAVVHGNTVFVGVASNDEGFAAFVPGYICCSFRGSVLALDANTGEILWKTYTAPDAATGFSGNGVWGSTPAVDVKRNSVYVTTGNNYSAPLDVLDCVADNLGDGAAVQACVDGAPGGDQNHFDSIISLDMGTGDINWARKALPFDAWTVACIDLGPAFPMPPGAEANCPEPAGPDYDFGQGPALYTVRGDQGRPIELVGAGQKSGQYWALDPDTGDIVWVTQVGAGGVIGGLQWGSAVDGERVYVQVSAEGWSALDARTGAILWQTPGPDPFPTFGAVSSANGVVYGGSSSPFADTMFAMDGATGDVLFSFDSGGSVGSGAAIVDGMVFWGSGYSALGPPFTGNNKLFAFVVP